MAGVFSEMHKRDSTVKTQEDEMIKLQKEESK